MEKVPKSRLVRCPRCRQLLPEPAGHPVYRCGGCGAILQSKSQSVLRGKSQSDSLFVDASDVYLSFMGADTSYVFVDFLYQSLVDAGIRVFPPGEGFGQQIPRAIDRAKICIPIFSKNYASSKLCLRELAAMVESKAKSGGGKTIIPIFYDVEPRDVRLLTSLYRDALSIHKENLGSDRVEAWEYALAEVASLRGWVRGSGR